MKMFSTNQKDNLYKKNKRKGIWHWTKWLPLSSLHDTSSTTLSFYKVDSVTNQKLSGAIFELYQEDTQVIAQEMSTIDGRVIFSKLSPGNYFLKELQPPTGYLLKEEPYTVVISFNGSITINEIPIDDFIVKNTPLPNLRIHAITQDNKPISQAIFTLIQEDATLQTVESDTAGNAIFEALLPGTYTLFETQVPKGYQKNDTLYTVKVSTSGILTIDETLITCFTFLNFQEKQQTFSFQKRDAYSNIGIAGAVFTLSSYGIAITSSTSDSQGLVIFDNVLPGHYELTESIPAPGYDLSLIVYSVVILEDNTVTIDGYCMEDFAIYNTKL